MPVNIPLPTKIVTEVLRPIAATEFGDPPDVKNIDEYVREMMQTALTALAGQRHFPIVG